MNARTQHLSPNDIVDGLTSTQCREAILLIVGALHKFDQDNNREAFRKDMGEALDEVERMALTTETPR